MQENEEWKEFLSVINFHKISKYNYLECAECEVVLLKEQQAKECDDCKQLFVSNGEELHEKGFLYVEKW